MPKFVCRVVLAVSLLSLLLPSMPMPVQAQNIADFLNLGNRPVEYDQPRQIGRGRKRPDSIDSCLARKEFFFNELHNIWVEGLVRCKRNEKGVLSTATIDGISTDPVEEEKCRGLRQGQILTNGSPSEEEARRWSERCAYLGTVGGAGPVDTTINDLGGTTQSFTNRNRTRSPISGPQTVVVESDSSTTPDDDDQLELLPYRGVGVKVPDASLVAGGISKETSLIELIVFYTNATLPYVSVLSVFVFVAAGLYYILSFTNEELHNKAKSMMIYVVIGIVIIFSAYTIVNTLLRFSTFQG